MMIYVDNAATTAVSKEAIEAVVSCMEETYGNPSSLHSIGLKGKRILEKARTEIAACLNASPREITFTSGGSESDNQAIRTAAVLGKAEGKMHIVSTEFEHHAVLRPLEKLKKDGFEVTLVTIPSDGIVKPEAIEAAIRPDTCLVSVMYANNEIGTIQPIREIGEICKKHHVLFHTDAVQAAGHVKIDVEADLVDFLSLSAHKFHGPKGVGVLYTKKGIYLQSLIDGGEQERGKRAGTENTPGIAGMAAALTESCRQMEDHAEKLRKLRDRLIQGLLMIPDAILNGDPVNRLPGNVNVSFPGVEGESLLLLLDQNGICASSGSACASGSTDPSHVLTAIGRSREEARGSIRFSLGEDISEEEVDFIIKTTETIVTYLRGMRLH